MSNDTAVRALPHGATPEGGLVDEEPRVEEEPLLEEELLVEEISIDGMCGVY